MFLYIQYKYSLGNQTPILWQGPLASCRIRQAKRLFKAKGSYRLYEVATAIAEEKIADWTMADQLSLKMPWSLHSDT